MKNVIGAVFIAGILALAITLAGCATGGVSPVKTQNYAKLSNHRTFEHEFPAVWKAIENTFRNFKVVNRDPKEVDPLEMKKLTRRTLETDWSYTRSNDKYQEYSVNNTPRKVYLQTRIKYEVEAQTRIGGVDVTVSTQEEVERLKGDGTSAGYDESEADPARANEILEKISNSILSAAP